VSFRGWKPCLGRVACPVAIEMARPCRALMDGNGGRLPRPSLRCGLIRGRLAGALAGKGAVDLIKIHEKTRIYDDSIDVTPYFSFIGGIKSTDPKRRGSGGR
jgi:hypothetical protein